MHGTYDTRFNPLPLPKQGEIYMKVAGKQDDVGLTFQSAPPAEARGDATHRSSRPVESRRFQSAPPAEARGDTVNVGC